MTSFPDTHKKITRDHFCKASSSQTKACTLFLCWEQHIKTSFYTSYMKMPCRPHCDIIEEMDKERWWNQCSFGSDLKWRDRSYFFRNCGMATVVTLLSTLNKRSHKYEIAYTPRLFRVNKLNVQR